MMHQQLSRELIRALRGGRSQPALSRRIGLRSNPVYRWEAGRAWPTARQLFQICRVTGVPVEGPLEQFLSVALRARLDTPAGVCEVLDALARPFSVTEMAERVGRSRFVLSRWLSGETEIRLPDMLRFVEVTSLRLLDFLSTLVDPGSLPSQATAWTRLQAARTAAYDVPWSHAVLRALELSAYAECKEPAEGWLAARLGIPLTEVRRALALLTGSGQIVRRKGRYVGHRKLVDTGTDHEKRLALRMFWSRIALERIAGGDPGLHSFNLFAVAEKDMGRIRILHKEFFERMRALIAESEPSERVVLYCAQMVALDKGP